MSSILTNNIIYDLVACIGANLFKSWLIVVTVINLCLFVRFLRLYYGSHTKPNPKKAILITGATSGLGLCMANLFYKRGYSIIAGYFNDKEPGYKQLDEYRKNPKGDQRLLLVHMNVRSAESVREASAEVDQWLADNKIQLYCLVNNAGTSMDGPFEWCAAENLVGGAETNFVGVLLVTRFYMKQLILSKGRVVNISSGLAHTPSPSIPVYGSTKCAVAYFTDALEYDVSYYGVKSYCVFPGYLVSSTNITYTRAKSIMQSIDKLTPDELKLYSKSIHVNKKYIRRLVAEQMEWSKADPDEVASTWGLDVKQFLGPPIKDNVWLKLDRWSRYLFAGDMFKRDLEDTPVMEAFEQAVCLRDPPKRLYAGNRLFSLYFGPFVDYLPWVLRRYIGKILVKGQYKL